MFDVGRIAIKIAGRDAGKHCVVVDVVDSWHVLIDGETRRRKVNVKHLEPSNKVIELKKGASHEDVRKEFEKLGMKALDTKKKEKKEKPHRVRKGKQEKAPVKKEKKKEKIDEKKKIETKGTASGKASESEK